MRSESGDIAMELSNTNHGRQFSRVDFTIKATVAHADNRFDGAVKNLSVRGMYLETGHKVPTGDKVEIIFNLDDQPENELTVGATVARVLDDGIAFKFDKVDVDAHIHLKNLVTLNIGNEDIVDSEVKAYLEKMSQ